MKPGIAEAAPNAEFGLVKSESLLFPAKPLSLRGSRVARGVHDDNDDPLFPRLSCDLGPSNMVGVSLKIRRFACASTTAAAVVLFRSSGVMSLIGRDMMTPDGGVAYMSGGSMFLRENERCVRGGRSAPAVPTSKRPPRSADPAITGQYRLQREARNAGGGVQVTHISRVAVRETGLTPRPSCSSVGGAECLPYGGVPSDSCSECIRSGPSAVMACRWALMARRPESGSLTGEKAQAAAVIEAALG